MVIWAKFYSTHQTILGVCWFAIGVDPKLNFVRVPKICHLKVGAVKPKIFISKQFLMAHYDIVWLFCEFSSANFQLLYKFTVLVQENKQYLGGMHRVPKLSLLRSNLRIICQSLIDTLTIHFSFLKSILNLTSLYNSCGI